MPIDMYSKYEVAKPRKKRSNKISFSFTEPKEVKSTDIDWVMECSEIEDYLVNTVIEVKNEIPFLKFLSSSDLLNKGTLHNTLLINDQYIVLESWGLANAISDFINIKFEKANKKVLKTYQTISAFKESREMDEAYQFYNYQSLLDPMIIYTQIINNVNKHYV